MARERWKQIDHPNHGLLWFDISSLGRVRNRRTGTIWKLYARDGRRLYLDWFFNRDGRRHHRATRISTAVCRAFKRVLRPGEAVEHLDGNTLNCAVSNLRIVSLSYLSKKAWKNPNRKRHGGRIVLSHNAVETIQRLRKAGYSQSAIARATGLNQPRISLICNGLSGGKDGGRDIDVDWEALEPNVAKRPTTLNPRTLRPMDFALGLPDPALLEE